MTELQRDHLYRFGCDFAFDVYLLIMSPRTQQIVSSKLRETMESLLRVLLQLRHSEADAPVLLRAAGAMLERLVVYIDIAADFLKLQAIKREALRNHQLALKFAIRSLWNHYPNLAAFASAS